MKATLVLVAQGSEEAVKAAEQKLARFRPAIEHALAHIGLELADEPQLTYEGTDE